MLRPFFYARRHGRDARGTSLDSRAGRPWYVTRFTGGTPVLRKEGLQIGVGVADEGFVAVDLDSAGHELAEGFIFAAVVDGQDLGDFAVGGEAEFEEGGVRDCGGAAEDVA